MRVPRNRLGETIRFFSRWEKLSPQARKEILLKAEHPGLFPVKYLGKNAAELIAAGIVETMDSAADKVMIAEKYNLAVLVFFWKHQLALRDNPAERRLWILEYFDLNELDVLAGGEEKRMKMSEANSVAHIAGRFSSSEYARDLFEIFTNAKNDENTVFKASYGPRFWPYEYFGDDGTLPAESILRLLSSASRPVPYSEIMDIGLEPESTGTRPLQSGLSHKRGNARERLERAVEFLVNGGLAFIALDPKTLLPVLSTLVRDFKGLETAQAGMIRGEAASSSAGTFMSGRRSIKIGFIPDTGHDFQRLDQAEANLIPATAFLVDDVSTLLVACSAGRVRVTSTREIFKKDRDTLVGHLVPSSVSARLVSNGIPAAFFRPEHRYDTALGLCSRLGFLNVKHNAMGGLIELPKIALEFMARDQSSRLRTLCDLYRDPAREESCDSYLVFVPNAAFVMVFPPGFRADDYNSRGHSAEFDRVFPLIQHNVAWSLAPFADGIFFVEDLVLHLKTGTNILGILADSGYKIHCGYMKTGGEFLTPVQARALWVDIMLKFLTQRLVPIGGIALGSCKGKTTFRITPLGAWFLGYSDEYPAIDTGSEEDGEVIIDSNFEITFTRPSLMREKSLAAFCERIAPGSSGTIYRIDRTRVLDAAQAGLDAPDILRILSEASSRPLPGDLAFEIESWLSRTRTISCAEALIVRCPDNETALRVLSLFKDKAELLAPTVLAFPAGFKRGALMKKLSGEGIRLEEKAAASKA